MLGIPDSCGFWAPCLSWADGRFYLIYTNVKRYGRASVGPSSGAVFRDLDNYLVTSERIDGEWSDPVYLNGSGFDPSLFHDDDGRKYLVNMLWDYRPGHNRFAGIVLQEYSVEARSLTGPRRLIFEGTSIGFTEGPHLYKRDGYYYLLTAEGGTGWGHAVTLARSRELTGPYELHPDVYVLTSRDRPDIELQRAGHADLVETQNGETYMAHLCGRPLRNRGRCTLGRETAIQPMIWSDDGWRRPAAAALSLPRSGGARRFRQSAAWSGLPVAAVPLAGGTLQPDGAPRISAALRPGVRRQPISPVAGGAAPAGALFQRRNPGGLRAREL
jgi:xylan 1,4-beta-xylosidase